MRLAGTSSVSGFMLPCLEKSRTRCHVLTRPDVTSIARTGTTGSLTSLEKDNVLAGDAGLYQLIGQQPPSNASANDDVGRGRRDGLVSIRLEVAIGSSSLLPETQTRVPDGWPTLARFRGVDTSGENAHIGFGGHAC